jgi:hypothetical protein
LGRERDRNVARAEREIERRDDRAQRSGMPPERSAARAPETGMFASFRPQQRSPEQLPLALREASTVNRPEAIRRYARALLALERMEEQKLPVLPHQQQAVEKARSALEKFGSHAGRDLDSAFVREPSLIRDAAAGQTRETMRAMRVEAEVRNNPTLRADRFVARWKDLDRQRLEFGRSGDWQAERSIRASMGAMGRGLERDAQMESVLRNRTRELGISMDMGRSLGRSITDYLGLGRERGLSL